MKKVCLLVMSFIIVSVHTTGLAQPGYITTIAGGTKGYGGDGGPATAGKLSNNSGICIDKFGNIYIADQGNNCVRKVSTAGIITTYAGTGISGFSGDGGPATAAGLSYTQGVAVDNAGNVYVADEHNNKIRKIDAAGIITTFIDGPGFAGDGGPVGAALVSDPSGVATDKFGNIYICDRGNNRIRKVDAAGIITTIAGNGTGGFGGDGGPATLARLQNPQNVCADNTGNIYIADFDNNRIRRVNAAGIIKTFAGNGGGGYSGDGGPATLAQISNHWGGVYPDAAGNLYIADLYNNCIRKIDNSGIITTIAGSTTGGYSGDGGPATAAKFKYPAYAVPFGGDLYISDQYNGAIRKISGIVPYTTVADSFTISATKLCNGPKLLVNVTNYASGMTVKTDFGDATTDVSPILSGYIAGGYAIISHTYNAAGVYPITQILYKGTTPIDTISIAYNYSFCRTLPVRLYYESNSNCTMDSGESYMSLPSVAQVDSDGIKVGTIPATGGFDYNAYAPPGTVYSFKLIAQPGNLIVVCPAMGVINDTVVSAVTTYPEKYLGIACPTGSKFDFGLKTVVPVTGVNDQWGNIYLSNKDCYGVAATVTMHFSPKWVFSSESKPTPATITSNTATWNIGTISANDPKPIKLYYVLRPNPKTGALKIRDTVHATFIITPTTGDGNTTDNTEVRIDTVRAGCDPNAIYVSPNGCVPKGTTNLEYTITFENTGNDTAHNIYVMDTLSDKLDVQSLRIVMASANMNFGILKDGPYTIAKFDFPNIKLLDSSHHGLCDGTVIYTVDMQKGLASDTRIYNRAGIYFDVNEVVLTNTSENIIGCPPLAIDNLPEIAAVNLYPNPTTDELTITTEKQYNSFTITNSIGQVMMEQTMTNAQTKVSVKALPAGLYYISLRGSEGVMVQKFVKL